MLDIGFLEVGVILIVALLVIGPERLPKVARHFGNIFAKLNRLWQQLREESEKNNKDNSDEK